MRFLKLLFFISSAFLFFALFFHNIIEFDQDLGRHLLMGKIISASASVPANNLLSYTFPNFQFINSHWLSEVIFYQIAANFGVVALLWLKVVVLITAFGLTVYTAYRWSKNLAAVAVATAIFAPVLLERTEIRPEIFSYLLTAIFLWVLMAYYGLRIKHYGKILWLLPILEILWVNLHIYFILGPILCGIFLVGSLWQEFRQKPSFSQILLNCKYEILKTVLVFGATLINPNFLAGALYPLNVFSNYGYSIEENQTVFFLKDLVFNPNINYFFGAVAAFGVGFIVTNWRKLSLTILLLAGLTILPFMAIRSLPYLFLIELPVFALVLANRRVHLRQIKAEYVLIVVIVLNVLRSYRLASNQYYLLIDSNKRFSADVAESGKGTLDFVIKNQLHGPMFNNFDIGSYLAYRLFPREKVFVDGRPEAYPAKFFQDVYIPMEQSAENFKTVDDLYKFNLIIFSHTDATPWAQSFLSAIIKNPNFALVYLDQYGAVFVRKPTPLVEISPEQFYQKFSIEKHSYFDYLDLAQASEVFGWSTVATKLLEKSYGQNPDSIMTNLVLGQVYGQNPAQQALGQSLMQRANQQRNLILF